MLEVEVHWFGEGSISSNWTRSTKLILSRKCTYCPHQTPRIRAILHSVCLPTVVSQAVRSKGTSPIRPNTPLLKPVGTKVRQPNSLLFQAGRDSWVRGFRLLVPYSVHDGRKGKEMWGIQLAINRSLKILSFSTCSLCKRAISLNIQALVW